LKKLQNFLFDDYCEIDVSGGRWFAGGGGDEGWVLFNNGGFCFVEGLRERKERSSREERERKKGK